jgi:hypothetical protein
MCVNYAVFVGGAVLAVAVFSRAASRDFFREALFR